MTALLLALCCLPVAYAVREIWRKGRSSLVRLDLFAVWVTFGLFVLPVLWPMLWGHAYEGGIYFVPEHLDAALAALAVSMVAVLVGFRWGYLRALSGVERRLLADHTLGIRERPVDFERPIWIAVAWGFLLLVPVLFVIRAGGLSEVWAGRYARNEYQFIVSAAQNYAKIACNALAGLGAAYLGALNARRSPRQRSMLFTVVYLAVMTAPFMQAFSRISGGPLLAYAVVYYALTPRPRLRPLLLVTLAFAFLFKVAVDQRTAYPPGLAYFAAATLHTYTGLGEEGVGCYTCQETSPTGWQGFIVIANVEAIFNHLDLVTFKRNLREHDGLSTEEVTRQVLWAANPLPSVLLGGVNTQVGTSITEARGLTTYRITTPLIGDLLYAFGPAGGLAWLLIGVLLGAVEARQRHGRRLGYILAYVLAAGIIVMATQQPTRASSRLCYYALALILATDAYGAYARYQMRIALNRAQLRSRRLGWRAAAVAPTR